MPAVTTGVIPSSINVPRFDAKIARIQYRGSEESDDMIPYRGTCEQTRKIKRVVAVHSTLWLKGTWRAGSRELESEVCGEDAYLSIGSGYFRQYALKRPH